MEQWVWLLFVADLLPTIARICQKAENSSGKTPCGLPADALNEISHGMDCEDPL